MPTTPLKVCTAPGCGALVRSGRCAQHEVKASDRRQHDPAQRKFYSSARWRQLSLAVRMAEPMCRECRDAPSESVDHINGDWRDNRRDNLQALCMTCHNRKSGRDHRRAAGGP